MAFNFNGSASLALGAALFTAAPFTFVCCFKNAAGISQSLLTADDGTTTNQFRMFTASGNLSVGTTATTAANATTGTAVRANMWNIGMGSFYSAANRQASLNQTATSGSGTSRTPAGINQFMIGSTSTGVTPWNGLIAEVAVWTGTALIPNEMQDYMNGVPPALIRPQSLILYMPLSVEQGIRDLGPRQLSFTNTAAFPVRDHPPMQQPVRRYLNRSRLARA